MIRSFGSKDTERIWHEQYVKGVDRNAQRETLRRLELLHAAKDVEDLRIPPRRINEIVHGKRGITADTVIRLARYLGASEEFWMNLQSNDELRAAA